MTREELEKEAEEYLKHWIVDEDTYGLMLEAFKDGAEPREKKIAELEQENTELKNTICTHGYYQNGYKQGKLEESRKMEVEIFEIQGEVELRDVRIFDLNKKVKELESQIEKMKCCGNCACLCECGIKGFDKCKNYNKWELKEIKENDKRKI